MLRGGAAVLTVQLGFSVVAFAMLAAGLPSSAAGDGLVAFGSVFFTVHAVWAFVSWHFRTRRLVDGYTVFLVSLLVFSGGHLLLWSFRALPEGILDGKFSDEVVAETILLTNAAVSAFHLGALACVTLRRSSQSTPTVYREETLRRIGVAFVVIGLPAVLMSTYRGIEIVATSGYMALYQQEFRTGVESWDVALSVFLTPGLLLVLAAFAQKRSIVWVVWAIALLKMTSSLLLGYRSAAILSLVPMLLVHDRVVRRVNRVLVAGIVAAGLVLIPWIAAVREMTLTERLAASRDLTEHPFAASLKEMGGTMATVSHTIRMVPGVRDYEYGVGYLRGATAAVPNLFWDRHPVYASGTYAMWLVREIDPAFANRGGGYGFSMIAEAFVNFGALGTPIVMAIAGFLLARMVQRARSAAVPPAFAFEAVILSLLLFLPRGEAAVVARGLVWCAVIPYWLVTRRSRAARRSLEPRFSSARRPEF
jgi:hypothetical protein